MKKVFLLLCVGICLSSCGCNCRYNEYIPENNPLVIPEDLKQK